MPLDESSVTAKLERARTHFQAVDDMFFRWKDGHHYRVAIQPNTDFTRFDFVVTFAEEPDLQALSLMFGDAVHNLRSSLDHLIYAVGVYFNNGTNFSA